MKTINQNRNPVLFVEKTKTEAFGFVLVVRSKRSVATQHVADLLTRDRRSILPSPGFKVVEIAFALDTAFMDQYVI
ncbi:hypothetical protein DPMN_056888 [Dreissena polymorpha]|uniref:Uncharacterized protein n=1 Tax=Dreissena polymorpha TaxID=45954 RepID=A0A9D4CUA3_DREPO|nr:hypothetical protein DPMN_056888 [Dreissena polymorpha]